MRQKHLVFALLLSGVAGLGAAGTAAAHGRAALDFDAIDQDASGALERAELEARGTERLAALDADGDGGIDRAEIIAVMPALPGAFVLFGPDPAEVRADRILEHFGADETGRIDIAAVVSARVGQLLRQFDTDADEAISREEIAAARAERGRGGPRGWHDHDGPRRRDD